MSRFQGQISYKDKNIGMNVLNDSLHFLYLSNKRFQGVWIDIGYWTCTKYSRLCRHSNEFNLKKIDLNVFSINNKTEGTYEKRFWLFHDKMLHSNWTLRRWRPLDTCHSVDSHHLHELVAQADHLIPSLWCHWTFSNYWLPKFCAMNMKTGFMVWIEWKFS